MTQLEMPLPRCGAPSISQDDVASLMRVLKSSDSWMTAEEIALGMYGQVTESLKRRVRAIASVSRPAIVSFPGSKGYNLWERCSIDEILHGLEALESQGKDMIRQANVYRAAYYRRYRGQKAEDLTRQLFQNIP